VLCEILKKYLDEDTTAGRSVFLIQADDGKHMPTNGISAQHMAEEAGDVA
jgi:hypothetical protein